MDVEKVLHMVEGVGDNSYAANSILQKEVMLKSEAVVTAAIREVCCKNREEEKIVVADLGCSSGPNALLFMSKAAVTISKCYLGMDIRLPEVQFFMNDLPGNDFNTLFRSIAPFYEDLYAVEGGSCDAPKVASVFVCGVPGSFFGRIFPKNSIHFVHSSSSLHYLSQVPQVLRTDPGARLNRRNIYLSSDSPSVVTESYMDQFQKDFYVFLRARAEELKVGGHMVLIHFGRDNTDPNRDTFGALAEVLNDMVSEGLVSVASLETFNLPIYSPSLDEMRDIMHREGSFSLRSDDAFKMNFDHLLDDSATDDVARKKNFAKYARAVFEPILASHFEDVSMDVVFERFAEKIANFPREKRFIVIVIFHLEKVQI